MSLRLKIHLIVGVLVTLFVLAVIALQVGNMRDSVREEVIAANRVAAQLLNRTVWLQAAQGTPALVSYLRDLGRVRSNEIALFDTYGRELYRSPPSVYKAGRDAPDWFEELVSPPHSVQEFNYLDGRLVIESNASRAALDAWDQFLALIGGGLLLLLLVNAVVYWVVGRTVRPFGQIVEALERVEAGRMDVRLAPLRGTEAAAIGAAFNRMIGGINAHIEAERRAAQAERELSDRRDLARWIDRHLEQERKLIARELHDELGQSVTAIRSLALSVAQRVAPHDAQAQQAATIIAEESSRLYDAMHGLIPRLAPLVLDAFGLVDALRDLVERTRRSQPGVQVELDAALDAEVRLGSDATLALYRAAQEGLTNALRHGQARRVGVSLRAEAGGVRLAVRDDGRGLLPDWQDRIAEDGGHYGLRWLTERIEVLDGTLSIGNAPPRGVELQVRLPFSAMTEEAA